MVIGDAAVASRARRWCVQRWGRGGGRDDDGRGRRRRGGRLRRGGSGRRLRQFGDGDGQGSIGGSNDGICSFSILVSENFSPHCVELSLKGLNLLLQRRDCSHAPIHWISKPHVCFVHQAVCCICSLGLTHLLQDSRNSDVDRSGWWDWWDSNAWLTFRLYIWDRRCTS